MNKKILSIVLAIIMVFTIVPLAISGATDNAVKIVETGTEYATFKAAFSAVKDGQTIQFLNNVEESGYLGKSDLKDCTITIDFNGYYYAEKNQRWLSFDSSTTGFTINLKNGTLKAYETNTDSRGFVCLRSGCTYNFTNMVIDCSPAGKNYGGGIVAMAISADATVNFRNCTITDNGVGTPAGGLVYYNGWTNATVNYYNTNVTSYTALFNNKGTTLYSGTFEAVGSLNIGTYTVASTSTATTAESKKVVVECNHNYTDGYCDYCGVDTDGNYPTDATVTTKATASTITTTTTSTTTTTTTSTSSGAVDCYQISDVSTAANWQLGWWTNSTGALEGTYEGNKRAALKKIVQVEYGKTYTLKLENNTIGLKYVLREYKADGSFLQSFGTVEPGGTYTPSSESVGFVSLTVYDNANAYSLISDGTIVPSMTVYDPNTTTTTTTTTTTAAVTSKKYVFLYSDSSSDFTIDTNGHAYNYFSDYNNTGMQITGLVAGQTLTFTSKESLDAGIYTPTLYCRSYSGRAKVNVFINDIQVATALDTGVSNGSHKPFALDSVTISTTGPVVIKFVTTSSGSFFPDDIVFEKTGDADPFKVSTQMKSGASIRLSETNGIRFYTQIDADKIAQLIADGYTVEMGTLIAPADLIGESELTLDSAFKFINVKYEATDSTGNFLYYEGGDTFVGSIVDIKEENTSWSTSTGNITREFVGRGYVKVTKDGESRVNYASYASDSIENNTRSLQYVASAVASNNYSSEIKALIKKWAEAVK